MIEKNFAMQPHNAWQHIAQNLSPHDLFLQHGLVQQQSSQQSQHLQWHVPQFVSHVGDFPQPLLQVSFLHTLIGLLKIFKWENIQSIPNIV